MLEGWRWVASIPCRLYRTNMHWDPELGMSHRTLASGDSMACRDSKTFRPKKITPMGSKVRSSL